MGVVQRQGIKYSILNWVGVLIGAVSTLYIYPLALEEFGLLRFLLDSCALLLPFVSLGISSVSLRFFPQFEDKNTGNHGYLALLFLWGLCGYLFFAFLALLLWPMVSQFYAVQSPTVVRHLWLLFPLSFLTLFSTICSQYSMNYKRIVMPSLLMEFSQKLALPIFVLAYWRQWLSIDAMLTCVLVYQILVAVGMAIYLKSLGIWHVKLDWPFFRDKMWREMAQYGLYGLLFGTGFLLVYKLDTWTVGTFVNLRQNGIYAIAIFIASILEVPARALIIVSNPLIIKHWHENNLAEIAILYRKVSINLLIIGLLLFGCFWVSATEFFQIIQNGSVISTGWTVILLLSIGKLADMALGVNNYILTYSKHFRLTYLQVLLPALLGIGLSVALIPRWGITGAATSTLCATLLYNFISFFSNWYFFRLQPFSPNTVKACLLAAGAFALVWALPMPQHPFLAMLLKSGMFALLFGAGVVWGKVSEDVDKVLNQLIAFLKSKFG